MNERNIILELRKQQDKLRKKMYSTKDVFDKEEYQEKITRLEMAIELIKRQDWHKGEN